MGSGDHPQGTSVLLEVDGLTVEFPGIRALDSVHFDILPGEVHALVRRERRRQVHTAKGPRRRASAQLRRGAAGRSDYRPRRPADASTAGIAVIYQEFNLYPDLTVAENVFSGREPFGSGLRAASATPRSTAVPANCSPCSGSTSTRPPPSAA